MSSFFVYILRSQRTEKLYIGSTGDLPNRLGRHNRGSSGYTKNGIPWQLVYSKEYPSRAEAVRREKQLKTWKNRVRLQRLIESGGKSAQYSE